MGERIGDFDFKYTRGRKNKYPWHEWTDGSVWRITQGVDFTCSLQTMSQSLYHRAVRFPFTVQVHKESETSLIFRFTPKEEKDIQPSSDKERTGD